MLLITTVVFAQQPLPSSKVRHLISGNTLSGKNARGEDLHVYHSPDGKMSGQARLVYHSSIGDSYDTGIWKITEKGNYCRTWADWREGKTDCFEMYRVGEDEFLLKAINHRFDSAIKIREGDPENLKVRIGSDGRRPPNEVLPLITCRFAARRS